MNSNKEDLSVAGPGSPISLKKFLEKKGPKLKEFTLLVDGSGCGIVKDSDECIYVTPEERSIQAIYYLRNKFDGRKIPAYLYRYMEYMFSMERDHEMKYKTDLDLARAFYTGELTEYSNEYITIKNLITYCDSNAEAAQVIGMIQILSGIFSMARKTNSGFRIYIEHPEHALHPKKQSRFVSLLNLLKEEYGINGIWDK